MLTIDVQKTMIPQMILLMMFIVFLGTATFAQAQSSNITPIDDVTVTSTATLVTAGSAFRTGISCTNHDAAVHVRWGSSSVTATKGQRFAAGATIEIATKGPVYMISEGANVTVSCTEEGK